jgi:hypothetical protein
MPGLVAKSHRLTPSQHFQQMGQRQKTSQFATARDMFPIAWLA